MPSPHSKVPDFLAVLGTVPVPRSYVAIDIGCTEGTIRNYITTAQKRGVPIIRDRAAGTIRTTSAGLARIRLLLMENKCSQ